MTMYLTMCYRFTLPVSQPTSIPALRWALHGIVAGPGEGVNTVTASMRLWHSVGSSLSFPGLEEDDGEGDEEERNTRQEHAATPSSTPGRAQGGPYRCECVCAAAGRATETRRNALGNTREHPRSFQTGRPHCRTDSARGS